MLSNGLSLWNAALSGGSRGVQLSAPARLGLRTFAPTILPCMVDNAAGLAIAQHDAAMPLPVSAAALEIAPHDGALPIPVTAAAGLEITGYAPTTSIPSTLLDGLTSYWSFDEASGNAVDAAGNNDLTANGSNIRLAGKIGSAIRSESTSNYFSAANNSELSLYDTDFSFSFWIGNADVTSNRGYFSKGTGIGSGNEFMCGRTGVGLGGLYVDIGGAYFIPGIQLTTAYKHIVTTFNKTTKQLNMYDNGDKYTETFVSGVPNAGGSLLVGKTHVGFAAFADIDELGFWRRVLTDDEVAALYNGGSGNAHPF